MRKLIQIQNNFTVSQKEKILRSVGTSTSENLLHSIRFGKKSIFALCENQFFWHCESNESKIGFECYESQGKIDRNKNFPFTVSFEDKTENHGKNQKTFTSLTIKNDLLTRRFDLEFLLTEEEKTALKYFFDCYFKNEPISKNFKMPKEKIARLIKLEKAAFNERLEAFFGKTEESEETKTVTQSKKETESKVAKRKSIGFVLNLLDFLADIAFLFAIVSLIKWEFLKTHTFNEEIHFLSKFNVQEFFIFSSLGMFGIFKLLIVLISKDSLKIAGILLFIIQGTTLFLLSPLMSQTPFSYRILLFVILNILMYFCFQMLVGNIFKTALQKSFSLAICACLLYLTFTSIQTIEKYPDIPKEFKENLLNKSAQTKESKVESPKNNLNKITERVLQNNYPKIQKIDFALPIKAPDKILQKEDELIFDCGRSGDPVRASAAGKVIKVSYDSGFGNNVVIAHDNDYKTVYTHMASTRVKKGQFVTSDFVIGYIGATGITNGPALGFRILKNDEAIPTTKIMESLGL